MKSAFLVKRDKSSKMTGDEAETKNERRLWCPDCNEPVRLHVEGRKNKKTGRRQAAHFEHLDHSRAEQAGCKLIHPYR